MDRETWIRELTAYVEETDEDYAGPMILNKTEAKELTELLKEESNA